MKSFLFAFLLCAIFSCGQTNHSSLELNLTSKNQDIYQKTKVFYLTSLTKEKNVISFENIQSVSRNKFIFKPLKNGLYMGLVVVEKDGALYNIYIDSIRIKNNENIIFKEINLGTIKL